MPHLLPLGARWLRGHWGINKQEMEMEMEILKDKPTDKPNETRKPKTENREPKEGLE